MRAHTILIALTAAAMATASFAQTNPAPAGQDRSSGTSERQSSESKASYGADDCRKDMANAKDAKQSGHITERELAEQKKMAQTKLKRDSGQAGSAQKDVDCK